MPAQSTLSLIASTLGLARLYHKASSSLASLFAKRKVQLLYELDLKLPPPDQRQPPQVQKEIHLRSIESLDQIPDHSASFSEEEKQKNRELVNMYGPSGKHCKRAMKLARIRFEDIDKDVQADYADRVNQYREKVPFETLKKLLPLDLYLLVSDHLKQKGHKFSAATKELPEATARQVTEKKEKLFELDKDLAPREAALKWLHDNRRSVRVNLEEKLPLMTQQAEASRHKHFGKARHASDMVHAYCLGNDLEGLMSYAGANVLRDNQITPFEPDIMAELQIRLFERELRKKSRGTAPGDSALQPDDSCPGSP